MKVVVIVGLLAMILTQPLFIVQDYTSSTGFENKEKEEGIGPPKVDFTKLLLSCFFKLHGTSYI